MGSPLGKLVVLSGPSGAGKTSVVRALKHDPRVTFSVSATTRAIRAGERDGVDYHFISKSEFEERIRNGEFLEWAEYNGKLYGTLRAAMADALAAGKLFLLEIEVAGTRQLRDQKVPGMYVFIVPPSETELRRRLAERGQNSPEEIEARLKIARRELQSRDLYDHVVVNEQLEATVAQVKALVGL